MASGRSGVLGRLRAAVDRSTPGGAAERDRRDRETLYRGIVETSREGVWVFDADYRTTFVNPQLSVMLGYTAEELLGTRLPAHVRGWDAGAATDGAAPDGAATDGADRPQTQLDCRLRPRTAACCRSSCRSPGRSVHRATGRSPAWPW
jgi:PAS domain-containing protein